MSRYLVKSALATPTEWIPAGAESELKGISKKFIKWALENDLIESLDGKPDIELTAAEEAELAGHSGCCG